MRSSLTVLGKVSFTTDTVFDVGSITKPFSASAILKLEMDGKLKVTDPITKFFKDLPDDKKEITGHQLLTHTAGLRDSLGGNSDKVGREDFFKLALASKLQSMPDNSYSFSNVGYSLLGRDHRTGDRSFLHVRVESPGAHGPPPAEEVSPWRKSNKQRRTQRGIRPGPHHGVFVVWSSPSEPGR